jgi:hypothetical protein
MIDLICPEDKETGEMEPTDTKNFLYTFNYNVIRIKDKIKII